LTLRMPPGIDDQALIPRALAKGLSPRALSGFALKPNAGTNGLVIGYGNTSAEELAPAVRTLSELAAGMEKPRRRRA